MKNEINSDNNGIIDIIKEGNNAIQNYRAQVNHQKNSNRQLADGKIILEKQKDWLKCDYDDTKSNYASNKELLNKNSKEGLQQDNAIAARKVTLNSKQLNIQGDARGNRLKSPSNQDKDIKESFNNSNRHDYLAIENNILSVGSDRPMSPPGKT